MICKVKKILDVKSGQTQGGEDYKSVDILLVELSDDLYPNEFIGNLFKKGEYAKFIDSLDFVEGNKVEVELKYKIREYNEKFYQQVTVWKIKKIDVPSEETELVVEELKPEDIPF